MELKKLLKTQFSFAPLKYKNIFVYKKLKTNTGLNKKKKFIITDVKIKTRLWFIIKVGIGCKYLLVFKIRTYNKLNINWKQLCTQVLNANTRFFTFLILTMFVKEWVLSLKMNKVTNVFIHWNYFDFKKFN